MRIHKTENEEQTTALAHDIAARISAPCFIALHGDLGAGKSVFARAMIRSLANDADIDVPSPTFTLVQHYDYSTGTIYHFDLYRLENERDVIELGWDDAVFDGICLVEWPERAAGLLPDDRIDINFRTMGQTAREITITPKGNAENYGL